MKRSAFIFFILFCCHAAFANITLPAVFSSNMILQQKTTVPVWGWGEAGKKVDIHTSWNQKTYSGKVAVDGSWKIMIPTPAAGGPYSISIKEGETITLDNVLIGEVWFCSGQSNMEMPMKGFKNQAINNSEAIISSSSNNAIRLFTVKRNDRPQPTHDYQGEWQPANPAVVADFSAVAYQYARMLQEKLQVPVGIISSSWGGTPIEAWMDSITLRKVMAAEKGAVFQKRKSGLYNGMIHPLAGFGIKGFLWYQGEANRVNANVYPNLMKAMITAWREKWNDKKLPFYYVQIAPFERKADSSNGGTLVREAQLKTLSIVPYTGMAVTLDIGSQTAIHPPDKTTVAERLLNLALAKDYGLYNIAWTGPTYKSMQIVQDTIKLQFNYAEKGLADNGKGLHQFEIAGEDKQFYPATAFITPDGIDVYSSNVKHPVAVRYAFKDWVIGDLYNKEGLPASSFRTDNW